MDRQTHFLLGTILVLALVVTGILLQPAIEEQLAPELVTAWVAVEVDGRGVAAAGPAEIAAGTPFRLYAVVEAEGPVYYTTAPALRLAGADVPGDRLRRWERHFEPRVRWFTVEGNPPYLELASGSDFERFRFEELYRPDWPLAWSVPGLIEPAHDDPVHDASVPRRRFGTQRYHVSVDFYDPVDPSRPKQRVASWNGGDVEREVERFPTVSSTLPGPLAPASRVFGLAQLELAAGVAAPDLFQRIDELARRHLAFSRATVLRDQLSAAGRSYERLAWLDVDLLAGDGRWGEPAAPGDLLRAGDRLVVLFEDHGAPGVLDHDDLCFDYARGASVRRLGDVFTGDGVVELASLGDPLRNGR